MRQIDIFSAWLFGIVTHVYNNSRKHIHPGFHFYVHIRKVRNSGFNSLGRQPKDGKSNWNAPILGCRFNIITDTNLRANIKSVGYVKHFRIACSFFKKQLGIVSYSQGSYCGSAGIACLGLPIHAGSSIQNPCHIYLRQVGDCRTLAKIKIPERTVSFGLHPASVSENE